MPKREVTSAPWAPVPARACTGKAPRARQHRAVGRLSTAPAPAEATCRGDLPAFRSDRRDPIPCSTCRPRRAHRAPRTLRQPARPGCRRADACVGRKVRGARADRGACGAGSEHPTERSGWPNASLPPSALLRVRAGPPLLRPLERLLVPLLHLVSGCSHGCSMLLPGLGLGLGLRACSVDVDSSKPNETIRLELATR